MPSSTTYFHTSNGGSNIIGNNRNKETISEIKIIFTNTFDSIFIKC